MILQLPEGAFLVKGVAVQLSFALKPENRHMKGWQINFDLTLFSIVNLDFVFLCDRKKFPQVGIKLINTRFFILLETVIGKV